MSLQRNLRLHELERLLKEKRNSFDKMISENKEFAEVKILFTEIRELERALKEHQETAGNGTLMGINSNRSKN